MDDLRIDALREQLFSFIDQSDKEIQPVIEQLAQLIAGLPDAATCAPDKCHYLVLLLKRIDQIVKDTDPVPYYGSTLLKLNWAIMHRLNPINEQWPEDHEL